MLLALQRYSLNLEFVSGKENMVADTLSRSFNIDMEDENDPKMHIFKIIESANVIYDLPLGNKCIAEIESESAQDSTFQKIKSYITNGWPIYISDVPEDVRIYYQFKDELAIYNNLILRNGAILIPYKMRKEMLRKLHISHNGVESSLKLAREAIFWPSMSADIKQNIQSCCICAKYLPKQQHFPMQSHDIPSYPWQYVSMDVFFVTQNGKQKKYLVTVDHYSDYFELNLLKDLTGTAVIKKCKKNFARHGIPEKVCTDGGTNFVCKDFSEFSKAWKFTHVTSSPHHPQGNGKAESAVKIAKKLINKTIDSGEDLWYAILYWRNTPNKINTSPVQRLYSRRTRTSLPMMGHHYYPNIVENVPEAIERRRQEVKAHYDKSSKSAPELVTGQSVIIQLQPSINGYWTPGIILERLSDRSYVVEVDGVSYRRDLTHIRPFHRNPEPKLKVTMDHKLYSPTQEENNETQERFTELNHSCDKGLSQSYTTLDNCSQSPDRIPSVSRDIRPSSPRLSPPGNIRSSTPEQNPESSQIRPRRSIKPPSYLKDYVTE